MSAQHSAISYLVFEYLNRRTAEPQDKEPQNIEVKNIVLFLSKTSAVRNSSFDIVLRTPHPVGGSPVSIFKEIEQVELSSSYQPKPALTSSTSMTKVCRVCSNSGATSSDLR